MKKHTHANFEALSPAELKAVKLICSGMSDAEAGRALHRSAKTVNKHRMAALQKLGIHSVVALTLKAVCAGVVDPCK
jgi:DNA-binding CsgD family transcriptional regulator